MEGAQLFAGRCGIFSAPSSLGGGVGGWGTGGVEGGGSRCFTISLGFQCKRLGTGCLCGESVVSRHICASCTYANPEFVHEPGQARAVACLVLPGAGRYQQGRLTACRKASSGLL